jgi:pyruvate ferredoxin oxidoreductase alpha subunit
MINPADKEKMVVVEGSYAVAHSAKTCHPNVISAYPITPQTHIVENLAQFIADGKIPNCEYLNVESEFSAISSLIGAAAVGARTYSATTSQGLLLMHEALFNASGMRFPIIMTVTNRAVSAPINIWNDHQDAIAQRDTGWIQLYVEDVQEASDTLPQIYKIAEDHEIMLPGMVCMDGYILSHVYEPVVLLEQNLVDNFLPPFRYLQEQAMQKTLPKIEAVAKEFEEVFGRFHGGLVDGYMIEDAEIVIMGMGSVLGTVKDVVDQYRAKGEKIGVLKVRSFRPFPKEQIIESIQNAHAVVVLDKNISIGTNEGALFTETKSCLYNSKVRIPLVGYTLGHGGRDIRIESIVKVVEGTKTAAKTGIMVESQFLDLKEELL